MYSNKYELNVLVGDKPVREYFHKNKFFVEAKRGTEYTLKLKNHGPKRIMAVFSVDGVDVLKGKNAAEAESGYIVNAFSTLTVKGFRIDDANVAAFKFDESGNSYASLVEAEGDPEKAKQYPSKNNGIIGCRIWEEKETKWVPDWKNKPGKKNFYTPAPSPWETNPYCGLNAGFVYSGCSGPSITGALVNSGPISGYSRVSGISGYSGYSGETFRSRNLAANSGPSPAGGEFVASSNNVGLNQNVKSTLCDLNSSYATCFQFGELESLQSITAKDPNFTVGTAWGQQIEDKVVKVKFEKAEGYIDLEIFYLERAELINYGVDVDNAKKVFVSGFPKAFASKEEYCKVPGNWRKS